jgi:hypothetical protein
MESNLIFSGDSYKIENKEILIEEEYLVEIKMLKLAKE